jgi:uncharacterized membrane protein
MPKSSAKSKSSSVLKDSPTLCKAIERNIKTFAEMRERTKQRRTFEERLADVITTVSGRMTFIYIHIAWFAIWIVVNMGKLSGLGLHPFDPYPFNFLTMVVSLEAIFLSTFVLISQNRLSVEADRRADLDLHIGLLTEHELTRVIRMLDAIQDKLGIDNEQDVELAELEEDVCPEAVLHEIDRIASA